MKRFFQEFKEFAFRGNVMALAVGVIIGGAFQGVVTSLSTNILAPIIGLFAGQNFDALTLSIFGVTILYGAFLTSVIDFFIMAFVVFLMVRAMNRLMSLGAAKKEEPPAPPPARTCPFCMTEIHPTAARCPACTSHLTAEDQSPAISSGAQ